MNVKTITLSVLSDYTNPWLLNEAIAEDVTEVLNIGCNGFSNMKGEIIRKYRLSNEAETLAKYHKELENKLEIYKQEEIVKYNKLQHEYNSLQKDYEVASFELNDTKIRSRSQKQQCIEELKIEYSATIEELKTQLTVVNTKYKTEREIEYKSYKEQLQNEHNEFKKVLGEQRIQSAQELVEQRIQLANENTKLQSDILNCYTTREKLISNLRIEYDIKLEIERNKIDILSGINKTSTKKGTAGEQFTKEILHKLFPNGIIVDTHNKPGMGDFHITYNNVNILYENKNFTDNVPKVDRLKFIKDVTNNVTINAGVMASQQSGIGTKHNLEMEYTLNGKPLIYLHNTNDNIDNIRLAVQLLCDNFNSVGNVSESKLKKIKNLLEILQQLNKETTQLQQTIDPIMSLTRTHKITIKNLETQIKDIINEPDSTFIQGCDVGSPHKIKVISEPINIISESINIISEPINIISIDTTHSNEMCSEPIENKEDIKVKSKMNSLELYKSEYPLEYDTTLYKSRAAAIAVAWRELSSEVKKQYQHRAKKV